MAIVIDGNNTPTAGGIGYGDGTELAFTTAGTSGRPIVSGGAGAPTFRPYTLPAADGSANQILQTDGAGALSFATPGGGFSAMDVLESGTTWTVPAGKTLIKIYVTGGGGGGSSYSGSRGAGGAGGTAIKYLTVTAGSTATIAIGAGGGAGPSGGSGPGGNGGDTTFTYGGVTYTGNGGSGATAAGVGGEGGSASGTSALVLKGQGGSSSSSGGGGVAGSSFWGGGAGGAVSSAGGNYGGGGGVNAAGYQGVITIEY